jgi:tRNA nucleotidyltransferase (CCA-adding enzyme)
MEDVTIVSTKQMQALMYKLESISERIEQMEKDRENSTSVWMTTKQVCIYINKQRTWVMAHKSDLGSSKRAGTLLFKRADIDAFINSDYFKK